MPASPSTSSSAAAGTSTAHASRSTDATEDHGLTKAFSVWEDREIRFDGPTSCLDLRDKMERLLLTFPSVEDAKGNPGESGVLLLTNMRIVWFRPNRRSTNLSIGYHCIQDVHVKECSSRLMQGRAETLTLGAKFSSTRYAFYFTSAVVDRGANGSRAAAPKQHEASQERLYTSVLAVWRAYDCSRVYRELRLRSAVVHEGQLIPLDGEHLISKVTEACNVSKEHEYPGTLILTNIRCVWYAHGNEGFNVSVPYYQLIAVRLQATHFGSVLVIETSSYASSLVLGFRVEPLSALRMLYREVTSLWRAFSEKPVLGVQVSEWATADGSSIGAASLTAATSHVVPRVVDGAEVLEDAPNDAFAAYYADAGQKGPDRQPVYDASIGLAVERPRRGVSIAALWEVPVS